MQKIALISGASRGIGAATAKYFGSEGYTIIVNYHRHKEFAEQVAQSIIDNGGNAMIYCADVSDYSQVIAMTDYVIKLFKRIDVLVCNAGVACYGLAHEVAEADFDRAMNVNCKGTFNCCKAVIPHMLSRNFGSIVTISSILGVVGGSCESVYSLTKGAIIAYSKALAKEVGESGIRVNTITAGLIDTDMNNNLSAEEKLDVASSSALRRIGTPEEVAKAIYFAATSEFVTGAVIAVDGGLII